MNLIDPAEALQENQWQLLHRSAPYEVKIVERRRVEKPGNVA